VNFAEHLKAQLNIVEVVEQYGVRLKRQGSGIRYVGLCPFHPDKTPSFNVNSGLGYFKCFGCGEGGDVFTFVQKIETLTFVETLKVLAERYGIPMPERQRSDDPEAQLRSALEEMHEIAAEQFQTNLRGPGGAEARRYLESRGVNRAIADEFRLGLSEGSGQQMTARLQRFGADLLEKSGLVRKREEGGFYDYFRGRLMFPIHSEAGKVIGFGGRALRSGDEPKYLNSPDTKLYKKSSVVYNLHRAKIDARKNDRMILVEGYMDVIGVYAAGIREVVASSGTSLGIDQVRSIRRQIAHQQASKGQIILNFDPDSAGVRSTEKYIPAFLAEGLRVKVLAIPGGLDPDEYIQKFGIEEYRKLLNGAASYFHWLADRARAKFDMKTAEGRMDAFNFMWPSIQLVSDKLERSVIASDIAEYLNVDRSVVMQNFKRAPQAEDSQRPRNISSSLPPNERILLACLLVSTDARTAVRHYVASSETFPPLESRNIFEAVLRFNEETEAFSLDSIASTLDERSQRILTEIGFADTPVEEESAAGQALDCLRALELKAGSGRRDALRRQIKELEAAGDFSGALKLADELDKLKQAGPGR
jgi:DNA primase